MEIFEIWQIGFVVCMKWILVVDLIGLKSKLDVNFVHCCELEVCEMDWFCFNLCWIWIGMNAWLIRLISVLEILDYLINCVDYTLNGLIWNLEFYVNLIYCIWA